MTLLQQQNSPAVTAIAQILPAGATLASIAPCADDIRHPPKGAGATTTCGGLTLAWNSASEPWHFIDEPVSENPASASDMQKYCAGGNCIIGAFHNQLQILTGKAPGDKATALMFVVHLVGDAHQPLHCATQLVLDSSGNPQPDPKRPGKMLSDGGGNAKAVSIPGTTPKYPLEMHSLWDQDMQAADVPGIDLSGASWQSLDPGTTPDAVVAQAAFESFGIARTVIYPNYTDSNAANNPDAMPLASDGVTRIVTPKYQSDMRGLAELRLQLAAVRLAAILDNALAGAPQTGSAPAQSLGSGKGAAVRTPW